MEFDFSDIRIGFFQDHVTFATVIKRGSVNEDDQLKKVEALHEHLKSLGVAHETFTRKKDGVKRIDQIRVQLVDKIMRFKLEEHRNFVKDIKKSVDFLKEKIGE